MVALRRCHVVAALLGATTGEQVHFRSRPSDAATAGVVSEEREHAAAASAMSEESTLALPTVSLLKVLTDLEAPRTIDYLSLDVEGSEFRVLSSFPFRRRARHGDVPARASHEDEAEAPESSSAEDAYAVHVISVERPCLCSRSLLRQHGFYFLRLLHEWGDELWVHEDFAGFEGVMAQLGVPEPLTRMWDRYHERDAPRSYAACVASSKLGLQKAVVHMMSHGDV